MKIKDESLSRALLLKTIKRHRQQLKTYFEITNKALITYGEEGRILAIKAYQLYIKQQESLEIYKELKKIYAESCQIK